MELKLSLFAPVYISTDIAKEVIKMRKDQDRQLKQTSKLEGMRIGKCISSNFWFLEYKTSMSTQVLLNLLFPWNKGYEASSRERESKHIENNDVL